MENKYLAKIKKAVLEILKDEEVKIILFGSRAREDNHRCSDVDIGILPYGRMDEKKLIFLRDKIEDLNIPYKVEIVNLLETSQDFRRQATKEAIVWKD